jgi:hypothetical protein
VCKTFQSLPNVGGILDQDSYFMHFVIIVQEAERDRGKLDKAREAMR